MKINPNIFTSFFILAFFVSCSSHHKLKEDDIKYIPYNGNEILVFKSDKDRTDTFFLKGMGNFNGCGDPLDFFPDKCDGISLNCTRTDPNYDRYLDGQRLVEIIAGSDKQTYISFDIILKGSWFYNLDSYSLSEFDKMPNSKLRIDDKVYNDVKIFEANNYAQQYSDRDNYVERFYWSVSHGFLGLDRKDEEWRLIEKYTP